jgi:hypothetical protein
VEKQDGRRLPNELATQKGGPRPCPNEYLLLSASAPQIDQLFASERELGEALEEVARLAVRLVMQPPWRPR